MTARNDLFGNPPGKRARGVQPAPPVNGDQTLAAALSPHVHLGTSTWSHPGWQGLVWAGRHGEATLAKTGLPAHAAHPLLRALWPGPLVARNLNRLHGAYGYEDAQTRAELAPIVRGTAGAGQDCFVTISNNAEGSAPLSVRALAQAIVDG